jgi:hypothetical protein
VFAGNVTCSLFCHDEQSCHGFMCYDMVHKGEVLPSSVGLLSMVNSIHLSCINKWAPDSMFLGPPFF